LEVYAGKLYAGQGVITTTAMYWYTTEHHGRFRITPERKTSQCGLLQDTMDDCIAGSCASTNGGTYTHTTEPNGLRHTADTLEQPHIPSQHIMENSTQASGRLQNRELFWDTTGHHGRTATVQAYTTASRHWQSTTTDSMQEPSGHTQGWATYLSTTEHHGSKAGRAHPQG